MVISWSFKITIQQKLTPYQSSLAQPGTDQYLLAAKIASGVDTLAIPVSS
jgi:hypothetical protein